MSGSRILYINQQKNREAMTTEAPIIKTRKAFCANCKGDRHCEIKGHHREYESDSRSGIDWWRNWYLLVCRGCEHVFAQSVSSDSESFYPIGYDCSGNIEYDQDEVINYWPAQFKRERPNWFDVMHNYITHDRASDFQSCLLQVYTALDHDLNILAAIGIRTTFDVASEILGIDTEQPFDKKLKQMLLQNYITASQKDNLDVLINAGNASAHRGWDPSFDELNALMGALEDFINDRFVRPEQEKKTAEKVALIKDKVPARKKRQKKIEAT
ncbi:DUF4145 domain-containing protein [Ochrobactrum sp. SFR4]|uniref:DUF4145 domain-containing protein n=1 Tax=Ochrobactrum sp. SFR4 TaxID=2717368 RepID=UPI001C8C9DD3|nr:DUF4145 domain-containing protein [Ochrobactrum sp. SFR4]MBX8826052.1 DUF4145 domain-containing protein [Ochrobactrum sp. SFR4]